MSHPPPFEQEPNELVYRRLVPFDLDEGQTEELKASMTALRNSVPISKIVPNTVNYEQGEIDE